MSGAAELKHGGGGNLHHLVECRDCGLFQRLHQVDHGNVAACGRCGMILRRTRSNFASLVCTGAAVMLFLFALDSPLMIVRAAGRFSMGTLFTGSTVLDHHGLEAVGMLVLLTLVVAPALKLTILLVALLGERSPHPHPWLPWLFGWLERLGPWAMVEVFLLGVFVAYTRLRAIASVEVGPSLIALGGVMLTMIAADASLDRHAIWIALDRRGLHGRIPARTHGKLIGCHTCGLVSRTAEGAACARCRHSLHHRKPNSIARSWALMIGAAALYIPANALPIMSVTRMGRGGPHTILSGVVELFRDHLWPLAVIVLLASVVVPLVKLGALGTMLVMTRRQSTNRLVGRTRLFRAVAVIGRWSMIDIFALTTLVALVRFGFLANVLPGNGALAFSGVVVLTMLATECFDPRLMWDAAQHHGIRALPFAVHSSEATV